MVRHDRMLDAEEIPAVRVNGSERTTVQCRLVQHTTLQLGPVYRSDNEPKSREVYTNLNVWSLVEDLRLDDNFLRRHRHQCANSWIVHPCIIRCDTDKAPFHEPALSIEVGMRGPRRWQKQRPPTQARGLLNVLDHLAKGRIFVLH